MVMVGMSMDPFSGDAPTGVAEYLDFKVSVTVADSAASVQVRGDLDCYTAPQLDRRY